MSITTRIADALPIRLAPRLFLTVQASYRPVSGTAGEVRARLLLHWVRRREVAVQDEDGAWAWVYEHDDVYVPLVRLPGRKLVELWDRDSERWLTGPVVE